MSASEIEGTDRISSLHDDIIHHIFSFLPTKSVSQTSILSKRWIDLWKFNQIIQFQLPTANCENDPQDFGFIDQYLSLHKASKILKFSVTGEISPGSDPEIGNWINFAVVRHVQSLELFLGNGFKPVKFGEFPNSFYTVNTESLKNLVVCDLHYNPPLQVMGFKGYASLKKIFLYACKLTKEALEATVSTSFVLETLILVRCYGLVEVKISSLALKKLIVYAHPQRKEQYLEIDAPNLVTLKTSSLIPIIRSKVTSNLLMAGLFFFPINIDGNEEIEKLLGQLDQIEMLSTDLMFLEKYDAKDMRCDAFKNLKEFHISAPVARLSEDYLRWLFAFLQGCPLLKKIQVDCGTFYPFACTRKNLGLVRINDRVKLENGDEDFGEGFLPQISSIEVIYFQATRLEMALVKNLLQKASNLEILSFIEKDPPHYVLKHLITDVLPLHMKEMLQELISTFPRASSHAQIVFC